LAQLLTIVDLHLLPVLKSHLVEFFEGIPLQAISEIMPDQGAAYRLLSDLIDSEPLRAAFLHVAQGSKISRRRCSLFIPSRLFLKNTALKNFWIMLDCF
jgi:hypothetical protein